MSGHRKIHIGSHKGREAKRSPTLAVTQEHDPAKSASKAEGLRTPYSGRRSHARETCGTEYVRRVGPNHCIVFLSDEHLHSNASEAADFQDRLLLVTEVS